MVIILSFIFFQNRAQRYGFFFEICKYSGKLIQIYIRQSTDAHFGHTLAHAAQPVQVAGIAYTYTFRH